MTGRALIIDTEATCITPEAQATELGWCEVVFDENGKIKPVLKPQAKRCKPDIAISYGSMAVTGIYPEDIEHEPPHNEVIPSIITDDFTYLIGHNIDYDLKVLMNAGVADNYKLICTLALCRYFYPDESDHKLTSILHMLDYEYAKEHSKSAHSAMHDVAFCGRILYIICRNNNITSMEQLYAISETARIPVYMTFGKHKGLHLHTEVPYSYKTYMLGIPDLDPYVRIAFEQSIAQIKSDRSQAAATKKKDLNTVKNGSTSQGELATVSESESDKPEQESQEQNMGDNCVHQDGVSEKPAVSMPLDPEQTKEPEQTNLLLLPSESL